MGKTRDISLREKNKQKTKKNKKRGGGGGHHPPTPKQSFSLARSPGVSLPGYFGRAGAERSQIPTIEKGKLEKHGERAGNSYRKEN